MAQQCTCGNWHGTKLDVIRCQRKQIEELKDWKEANQTLRDRPDIHYQILDSLFIHGEAIVYDGEVLDPAKVVIHRKKKELSEDLKEAVERRVKSLMLLIRAGSFPLIAIEVRKLVESGLKFAGEGPLVKAARVLMGPVESTEGTPIQETPEQKELREKIAGEVTEAVVQDVMDASYEPERVKIPVKFVSGTWPICCNVEMVKVISALKREHCFRCEECGREEPLDPDDEAYSDDCPCGDPTCLGCGERDDADEDFGEEED